MSPVRAGHLFAGIDGFGLGLSHVGVETAWTCELDPFCDDVLALRLPGVERFRDVRELAGPPRVQIVTGGFPCQDLSRAGLGAGITGARSGLYAELVRVVADVEPDVVLIENVPALLHRGMELVVRDLVALGYGVEWDCFPAAAFGAPHLRDRVWLVAHRASAPRVFGQPAALFPLDPGGAADLVGGDEDDDDEPARWLRWPRAGWVHGDPGLVMPLQPLAPLQDVRRGDVALWPTPTTGGTGYMSGNARNVWRPCLANAVRMAPDGPPPAITADRHRGMTPDEVRAAVARDRLPTPTASDHKGPGPLDRRPVGDDDLATRVARTLWPTPKASPSGPDYARAGRERSGGDDLATAVARTLWPTPRATDGDTRNRGDLIAHAKERANDHHPGPRPDGRERERRAGALNPPWVEWLMGFPIGWTDLDVPNADLVARAWEDGDDGLPRVVERCERRRERLTALGNALIPQAPAWLASRALDLLDVAA